MKNLLLRALSCACLFAAAVALMSPPLTTPAGAADLSITAANVAYVSGPTPQLVIAAETVTAGQPCYLDTTVNQYRLCKALTSGKQTPNGIALSGASSGGYFILATSGTVINTGATVTKNTVYYVSGANAGGIAPLADITTSWQTCTVLIATTSANAQIVITNTGVTN